MMTELGKAEDFGIPFADWDEIEDPDQTVLTVAMDSSGIIGATVSLIYGETVRVELLTGCQLAAIAQALLTALEQSGHFPDDD